jgi:hypothetical protein
MLRGDTLHGGRGTHFMAGLFRLDACLHASKYCNKKNFVFYYFFGYRNGADLLPLVAIAPFYSFGTYKLLIATNPRTFL